MKNILIIGATGHFGGRICRRLLGEENTQLIVTSRNKINAQKLQAELEQHHPSQKIQAATIDQSSDSFCHDLKALSPDIVIHAAGPYQHQSYRVAKACIATKSHYIDLADGRDFVECFHQLDAPAKNAGVLLISGASTLPGLSSAVIDHFSKDYQTIDVVKISIAPAHQAPRGTGTITAVLSYCGRPFQVWEKGQWVTRFGWQNLQRQRYPRLGSRLSAICDVPDLALLPEYLSGVQTVTFHAALEVRWEQLALWTMGWVTRVGLIKNWINWVPVFNFVSKKLIGFGSDKGGMHVHLSGLDLEGNFQETKWYLTALNNHGPEIPCTPAIILARKLAQDKISLRGATPCLGLMSLAEFDHEVESLKISWQVDA